MMEDKIYQRKLRENLPIFVEKVNPEQLLPFLPCLTNCSREEIQAVQNTKGRSIAVQVLHDNLIRRSKWWIDLTTALRDPQIELPELADLIDPETPPQDPEKRRTEKKKYRKEKRRETTVKHNHYSVATRLSELPPHIINELKLLDCEDEHNWRTLASIIGYNLKQVKLIESHPKHGSSTLALLEEWGARQDGTLGELIRLLEHEDLGRLDIVQDIKKHTGPIQGLEEQASGSCIVKASSRKKEVKRCDIDKPEDRIQSLEPHVSVKTTRTHKQAQSGNQKRTTAIDFDTELNYVLSSPGRDCKQPELTNTNNENLGLYGQQQKPGGVTLHSAGAKQSKSSVCQKGTVGQEPAVVEDTEPRDTLKTPSLMLKQPSQPVVRPALQPLSLVSNAQRPVWLPFPQPDDLHSRCVRGELDSAQGNNVGDQQDVSDQQESLTARGNICLTKNTDQKSANAQMSNNTLTTAACSFEGISNLPLHLCIAAGITLLAFLTKHAK